MAFCFHKRIVRGTRYDWLTAVCLCLLWAGWLIAFPVPVAAQDNAPQTVTLEEYRALLAESRALVAQDDALGEFPALADRWEVITAVEITRADGTTLTVPVQHSYLSHLLRAEIPNFGLLRRTFNALDTAADSWPLAPQPLSPAEYNPDRAALDDLLARPEFQAAPSEPNLVERIRRQMLNFVNNWLVTFLPQDVDFSGGGWIFTIFLPVVLGVVLTLVLVVAIRRLATDFVTTTAVNEQAWSAGDPLTAAAAYQQAQTTSSAGDYRTAVRYLYLSTLLALDERDLLRYDRAATNREYLRRIADQPDLHALLSDVVDVFDRVWYGFQPISRDTYDTYAARVADLQRQRRRRRAEREQTDEEIAP
ncbi:MAG: DUF4129 domain-containing protein [Anaerolineales bacterium]|nr:DUF4129 domain-containing protein [Anaerolineales bacterium]